MSTANSKLNVAIIGCGNIAGPYAQDIQTYPELNLLGATDIDKARASDFAAKHNIHAYPTIEDVLADERVDLAVNLTTHHVHKAITEQSLNAGKHVYSEKPLALTTAESRSLVELARQKNLRLGCSPFTLIGEAQQTAWKLIRDGKLGTVRIAYAEVNWWRIESWHPAPGPFYEVGALFDVGVYPLTILTAILGPARRVFAYGKVVFPDRVTKEAIPFHIATPDFVTTTIEMKSGAVVRLTTDFYVSNKSTKQTGIEFHGDLGSVHLHSWQQFDSPVELAEFGQPYQPVQPIREPYKGTPWGRGVYGMVSAILEGRPHRFTGEHAAHVTEILCAAAESVQRQQPIEITSEFSPPLPAEWAG